MLVRNLANILVENGLLKSDFNYIRELHRAVFLVGNLIFIYKILNIKNVVKSNENSKKKESKSI